MKSTSKNKWLHPALLLAMVALLMAVACVDSRNTIRHIDQHPGGDFNTVETSSERIISVPFLYEDREHLGIVFWNCQQSDDRLLCDRICDERWTDDRICRPELHHEFGQVSKPGAGVVSAKYRAQVRELEAKLAGHEGVDGDEEVAEEEDQQSDEESPEPAESQEMAQEADDEMDDEVEEADENGGLPSYRDAASGEEDGDGDDGDEEEVQE